MERKLVTINGAAEAASVTRRTIHDWINAGKVEYVRTVGGAVRIYQDSLFREADRRIPRIAGLVDGYHDHLLSAEETLREIATVLNRR